MNVNSFTVFGSREVWIHAVAVNLRQHFTFYPGWTFWLHTDRELDDTGYCPAVRKFAEEGLLRVSVVPDAGELYQQRWLGMMQLWRMLPLWQADVNYVFCRDLDSIFTPRQLQCARSFIASGKDVHGINDNPQHTIPLMGGMCGFKAERFRATFEGGQNALIDRVGYNQAQWNIKGSDQDLLHRCVWPRLKHSALLHRLEGPNRRSHLKNVADADISDIHWQIREHGDDFTNYIGAAGCNVLAREIIEFYNQYGNREKCRIITDIEESLGLEAE